MLCECVYLFFIFLCHNCAPISPLNDCKAITNALLSSCHFGDLVNEFSMPWHYIQQNKERNSETQYKLSNFYLIKRTWKLLKKLVEASATHCGPEQENYSPKNMRIVSHSTNEVGLFIQQVHQLEQLVGVILVTFIQASWKICGQTHCKHFN